LHHRLTSSISPGIVYNNLLTPSLLAYLPSGIPPKPFITQPSLISSLPPEIRVPVQQAYIDTLSVMFKIVVGTGCGVAATSMLLRKGRLMSKKVEAKKAKDGHGEAAEHGDSKAEGNTVAGTNV
jgi:hypothetical protein